MYWSEVFENNPFIKQIDEQANQLVCIPEMPGLRQYIDYENSEVNNDGNITRFCWKEGFKAPKGEIYFSLQEKAEAAAIALRLPTNFIVVEPNVAQKPYQNRKSWPFDRWQSVIESLSGEFHFVQFSQPILEGVIHLETPTFRQAAAMLSVSGGLVSTDGGLHHASAALGIPAVVLWGHYSSPTVLGYDDHINLRKASGIGCGYTYGDCPECDGSLDAIEVDEVIAAIRRMVNERPESYSTRESGDEGAVFSRVVGSTAQGGQE
jgi:ADP-heptose:LPS heptosyltransferase